jgi:predicted DNA-binding protein
MTCNFVNPPMPRGDHNDAQTAFRLPEGLLVRLRTQAKAEDRTMTAIVKRALEDYFKKTAADRGPSSS